MYFRERFSPLADLPPSARTETQGKPAPARAVLAGIPSGRAGTAATLRIMRDYVRAAIRNPQQIVRAKALELVRPLPPRNWMAQIYALHDFVQNSIRYVKDPVGIELVQTPEATLDIGQGDCDDQSTLLAALLESIGHPARFVAVAFNGDGFSHVLTETKVRHTGDERKDWMALETIIPKPPGWFPEGVTERYKLKV